MGAKPGAEDWDVVRDLGVGGYIETMNLVWNDRQLKSRHQESERIVNYFVNKERVCLHSPDQLM